MSKMPSRMEKMISDVNELAAKLLVEFGDEVFRNIVFDDNNFRFEVKDGQSNLWHGYSVCFSREDYPQGTVICELGTDAPLEDQRYLPATASQVFDILNTEHNLSSRLLIPGAAATGKTMTLQSKVRDLVDSFRKSSDESMASSSSSTASPLSKKKRTTASSSTSVSEKLDLNAEVYDSDDNDDFYNDSEPIEVNSSLKKDLAFCRDALGRDGSCDFFHQSSSLEMAHVVLSVPYDGINEQWASAWGLEVGKRICIKLTDISVVNYRNTIPPEVKVNQEHCGSDQGTCLRQLQNIVKTYLSKNWRVKDENDYGNCILLQICLYVLKRIPTLCDFCVICDERHELTAMFMPSVCTRDLCIFAYETLGVMAQFDVKVTSQIEVVDLLLKLLRAATMSTRYALILEPFPSIPDPVLKTEMAIVDKNSHYQKLVDVVHKIPCTRKLRELNDSGQTCVEALQQIHQLLFPLMRWVITSNRAYVKKLAENDRLPFLNTPHQYVMLLDSPEKEAAFRDAKIKHGSSVFAFHGSPFENWHSILRRGLINASGTNLQLTGAAYGKGIYLSPRLAVSMGYALKRYNGPPVGQLRPNCQEQGYVHDCTEGGRFLGSQPHYTCVALCEVIPTAELKKAANKDIWVLENPELVCTRFFLVFDGLTATSEVNCNDQNTLTQIREAVDKFRQSMART